MSNPPKTPEEIALARRVFNFHQAGIQAVEASVDASAPFDRDGFSAERDRIFEEFMGREPGGFNDLSAAISAVNAMRERRASAIIGCTRPDGTAKRTDQIAERQCCRSFPFRSGSFDLKLRHLKRRQRQIAVSNGGRQDV